MFEFKTSVIFLMLVTSSSVFGKEQISPRIVGGNIARAGQFPFAAAIQIKTQTSQLFCSGALLASQWVITSGVCVFNAISFEIHLGSNFRTEKDENRVVLSSSEYVVHPEFNPSTLENDLGLIKLRMPIEFSQYIQPINARSLPLLNYTSAVTLGWGQTSDENSEYSEELQFVEMAVLPNVECELVYGSQINDKMVCLGGQNDEGICIGDSGVPLLEYIGRYAWLIGIGSFYSGNGCENSDPSGFTRTEPFIDWIYSNVAGTKAKIHV